MDGMEETSSQEHDDVLLQIIAEEKEYIGRKILFIGQRCNDREYKIFSSDATRQTAERIVHAKQLGREDDGEIRHEDPARMNTYYMQPTNHVAHPTYMHGFPQYGHGVGHAYRFPVNMRGVVPGRFPVVCFCRGPSQGQVETKICLCGDGGWNVCSSVGCAVRAATAPQRCFSCGHFYKITKEKVTWVSNLPEFSHPHPQQHQMSPMPVYQRMIASPPWQEVGIRPAPYVPMRQHEQLNVPIRQPEQPNHNQMAQFRRAPTPSHPNFGGPRRVNVPAAVHINNPVTTLLENVFHTGGQKQGNNFDGVNRKLTSERLKKNDGIPTPVSTVPGSPASTASGSLNNQQHTIGGTPSFKNMGVASDNMHQRGPNSAPFGNNLQVPRGQEAHFLHAQPPSTRSSPHTIRQESPMSISSSTSSRQSAAARTMNHALVTNSNKFIHVTYPPSYRNSSA